MLGLGDAAAFVASRTQDATSIRPSSASASRAATRRRMAAGSADPHTGRQVRDDVQNVRQADGRVAAASADRLLRHQR